MPLAARAPGWGRATSLVLPWLGSRCCVGVLCRPGHAQPCRCHGSHLEPTWSSSQPRIPPTHQVATCLRCPVAFMLVSPCHCPRSHRIVFWLHATALHDRCSAAAVLVPPRTEPSHPDTHVALPLSLAVQTLSPLNAARSSLAKPRGHGRSPRHDCGKAPCYPPFKFVEPKASHVRFLMLASSLGD
jgi:hypothetical protein